METANRFSQCLLEQKTEESRQAKRLRRRTVLLAVLVQAVALGLLMLRPLLGAQAEMLMIARFVPGVPWKGSREPAKPVANRPRTPHHAHSGIRLWLPDFIPTTIPHDVNLDCADAPEIGPASDAPSGLGTGDPNGLLASIGSPGAGRPLPPPPAREPEAPPPKPKVVPPKVQEARLVTRVDPVYPVLAKQARLQGTVLIRAVIARDGSVESLEVVKGNILLAQAAVAAIAQWRYRPTLLNGQPVEVETLITVIFTLQAPNF